ncbi:MAG TPA: SDR family oxidoreductase [Methanomassiliicoccales archaeon]|jgi:NAD(P)-dependent dehydrogenase (short-subunit alcohol dehydrogenase family)
MANDQMKGKIVLITGATSGIGRETAYGLAGMGAKVVILARNAEKAAATIENIKRRTGNMETDFIKCDLASLDSVRKAADVFRTGYQRLDVLIDNAGLVSGKRKVTIDGFEYTFQVNHLSHFLLTNLLLDVLKRSAPSRVIVVGSAAHSSAHLDFNDLMMEKNYSSFKAYGRSKLANLLFCFELARRLQGTGVTANCLHPGVVRTNFGHELEGAAKAFVPLAYPFMISARKGATTSIYLASAPEMENVSGKYFSKKRVVSSSPESTDQEVAKRLWDISAKLTGLDMIQ